MKLKPYGKVVLIKKKEEEEIKKGDIILSATSQQVDVQCGMIIEVPNDFKEGNYPFKLSSVIYFPKSSGLIVDDDIGILAVRIGDIVTYEEA